ncbi:hypothetical protein J6590_061550 [Homalodisca vitripennis]|nr:hypothetical protein J6590_061550 [Homalodisca vitripennis]
MNLLEIGHVDSQPVPNHTFINLTDRLKTNSTQVRETASTVIIAPPSASATFTSGRKKSTETCYIQVASSGIRALASKQAPLHRRYVNNTPSPYWEPPIRKRVRASEPATSQGLSVTDLRFL